MSSDLPPFCDAINKGIPISSISYGGPPSNVTGDSTTNVTGGPPSNVTGGPPSGVNTGGIDTSDIPKMGLVDICFIPNPTVEFTILALVIIYYIPTILLYIKYRNHLLIRYRQPMVVLFSAILSAIMSILVPIFRYKKCNCYINTWTITLLIFSTCIITYSRYVRTYYIQQLSIFKLRFGESKNTSHSKEKRSMTKLDAIKTKDLSLSQQWEAATLKTNSLAKGSSISNDGVLDVLGITDPILYFKKLNQIINKKLVIILVIIPIIFVLIYNTYITIKYPEKMARHCANEIQYVGTPKLILCTVIIISSIFLFYQAYYKQKWDIELKIEYTVYIIFLFICNLIMQLSVRELVNDVWIRYRMYIFHFFTALVHLMCVVIPLIKIGLSKIKKKEGILSEEEFLARLSDSTFKAQVKEIATNTFCIENVLFFEAHCDLMNMIISYYSKKNNIPSSEITIHNSSDVMHKFTINPILYQPFDNIFKRQFEQVYNLYIKEDGIAAINIKSTTIKAIEEQMESDNYSYLIFNEAAEEVIELLYNLNI